MKGISSFFGTVSIILFATFSISAIPYVVFSINNPGVLTLKFKVISYLFDPSISTWQGIIIFTHKYFSYFGLDFLLLKGDANLRHATGYGGQLFIAVFLLSFIGLIWCIIKRDLFRDKFLLLIFISTLLSPVAASLTAGGIGPTHALRSILLGLYILLFSCYGLLSILSMKNKVWKISLTAFAFVALLLQVYLYINHYFTRYEEVSIRWFESYDFKNTLIAAIEREPEVIVISRFVNEAYILLEFYKNFINNPRQIPIYVDIIVSQNNTCFIYFTRNDPLLNIYANRLHDFSLHDGVIRLSCD